MNTCDDFRLHISRLMDNDLSQIEEANLHVHPEDCKECKATQNDYLLIREILQFENKKEIPETHCISFPNYKKSQERSSVWLAGIKIAAMLMISTALFLLPMMLKSNAKAVPCLSSTVSRIPS